MISFTEMERVYKEATAGSAEPDLIVLGALRPSKAVRRKLGRMLKRGQAVKGECIWPFLMHGKYGAVIV